MHLQEFIPMTKPCLSFRDRAASLWRKAAGAATLLAFAGAAYAQKLPEVPVPADIQKGGYIVIIRWALGVILLLLAVALAGNTLLGVASAAFQKFHQWNAGEKGVEMGHVVGTVVLGLVILAIVIMLAYAATQIIPTTIS
jgi:hypothetical protein